MAELSTRDAVLLEGTFAIYPKLMVEYHVLVTNSEISYELPSVNGDVALSARKSAQHVIRFNIFCHCLSYSRHALP